ncbi:MAG: hypothetical protein WAM09_07645 [Anaerolineales bacterium]
METFSQKVEAWHDYYLMSGAAAATLIGLHFLDLSLMFNGLSNLPMRASELISYRVTKDEKY